MLFSARDYSDRILLFQVGIHLLICQFRHLLHFPCQSLCTSKRFSRFFTTDSSLYCRFSIWKTEHFLIPPMSKDVDSCHIFICHLQQRQGFQLRQLFISNTPRKQAFHPLYNAHLLTPLLHRHNLLIPFLQINQHPELFL